MANTDAAELLDELGALRQRARREKHGYWLPLLMFGVLILLAPFVYAGFPRPPASQFTVLRLQIGGTAFLPFGLFDDGPQFGDPLAVVIFWLAVVVVGSLVTIGWYHWRAARVGLQPRLLTYVLWLLAALLVCVLPAPLLGVLAVRLFGIFNTAPLIWTSAGVFVLGCALAAVCARGKRTVLRRIFLVVGILLMLVGGGILTENADTHGFGPLFMIAIGLIGLAWMERSVWCGAVAAAFIGTALLANLYNMENIFFAWFGGDPLATLPTVFANLALPGVVLIVGGIVALVMKRSAR